MHFPSHSREVHQGSTKVWHELVELFVDQFIFNTMIDVTLRDLETTKQGFELFLYEFRGKRKMVGSGEELHPPQFYFPLPQSKWIH